MAFCEISSDNVDVHAGGLECLGHLWGYSNAAQATEATVDIGLIEA
jgi:hypothetical protein